MDYSNFINIITGPIPIIFTNFLTKFDLEKVNFNNFCEKLKDKKIKIRYGNYGTVDGIKTRKFKKIKMIEFCKNVNNKNDYGGNNIITAEDFQLLNIKPNCSFFSKFPKGKLWIGPQNSRTPLHKDRPKNLALQLYGKKNGLYLIRRMYQNYVTQKIIKN